jgi:plasmid stabilization system protein ParE
MRVRYTEPAALELEASILYFCEHAPSVVVDFADNIDNAVAELLDHPYSAQETEHRGVRRKYIRRFRYSIFYTVEDDEIVILHIQHAARRRPWEAKRR